MSIAVVDPPTDDAVLVAAARHDRQAFRFLYERHFQQIFGYCCLKLGNRELAEDATSEVFIKAMTGLHSWRGSGAFAGWLFRIAQNVITDTAWKQRAARRGLSLDSADPIADPGLPLEERAIASDQLAAIRDALGHLPSEQRVMVELQIAGLSTQEIARALGKSPGAVRMLRLRAFQQLRPLLAASGHDPDEIGGD